MIAVLGANGLIGHALALDLKRRGFTVRGFARSFTSAQQTALGDAAIRAALVNLRAADLTSLLEGCDMVINTIGILQGPDSDTVHRQFAARLAAVCATAPQKLLVHMSLPGEAQGDRTTYSRTKRAGEAAIATGASPYVILRPGFVIGAAAYGGSALMRALATLPLSLPARESGSRFAGTAMQDLCETTAHIAVRWEGGEKDWRKSWDVMEQAPGTVGDIVAAFRRHGGGPKVLMAVPGFLLVPSAVLGDVVSWLGWKPPIRSTAITEMRRGIAGDPQAWMRDTGLVPLSAREAVAALSATVQEKWFARLYLLKAVALVTLVIFWCASALIALTVGFSAARQILIDHGFPFGLAHAVTIVSSLMDFSVGILIAWRRTSAIGLVAGILVSLGYMAAAAILTPDMWIEPLGALVKTFPAIILMMFCLAMLDDR